MADAARKEKLAAAKKKLKNFQKGSRAQSQPASPQRNKLPSTLDNSNTLENSNSKPNHQGKSPEPTFQSAPSKTSTPKHVADFRNGSFHAGVNHTQNDNTSHKDSANNNQQVTRTTTSESTEHLQQMSNKMNGLLTESNVMDEQDGDESGDVTKLEERNRELAENLNKHVQMNNQLTRQIQEMKQAHIKLQSSFDHEKKTFDEKLKRELGALKEQLQVHIQTIGILVAEKTELQSSLNQSQKLVDVKIQEVEEYSGRLKASRQRVSDLERSFSSASSDKHKNEQVMKDYQKDVDRLKMELYKLNKSNDEYQQQNSELQGKLQKKVAECQNLSDGLMEVRGKLEMSDLHIKQLQNGGVTHHDTESLQQIENLLSDKAQLQMRIDQYEEQFEQVSRERDHISQQYQEYIGQLHQQTQTLQIQINTLADERDELLNKNQELENIIDELRNNKDVVEASASEVARARQELAQKVEKMVLEVGELKHKYETQVADNSQLSRLVMEKEEHIMELELKVHQLSDNQIDKEKLLDSMQSDKTALSRAMAQNKELKNQLAELQNGFVKMSNDNMEMVNKYQSEQHVCKELGARLGQQEQELKEIREQLIQKEQLLQEVQRYADVLQQHHGNQHPGDVEERLKEFQQQTPLIETLQRELTSAQDTINTLTNQNGDLRTQIIKNSNGEEKFSTNTEQVESLTAAIRQLELERNQIMSILQEEKEHRLEAEATLTQLQDSLAHNTPATLNGDVINKAQFEALQHAMKQLEVRYTKAMRDKADLTDKTEQLEHIIMQLQGETDTIAEYIALYQTQRMLLRERQEEKDDYISRLAREREDQADKLTQLQGLLLQVLNERQAMQHTPNHAPVSPLMARTHQNKMAGKLDSSHLEDWPDYTSSDSDTSEVEPIVGGEEKNDDSKNSTPHQEHTIHADSNFYPAPDLTAQKIMNLLSEIGSAVHMDSSDNYSSHFLHCNHCTGRIITV